MAAGWFPGLVGQPSHNVMYFGHTTKRAAQGGKRVLPVRWLDCPKRLCYGSAGSGVPPGSTVSLGAIAGDEMAKARRSRSPVRVRAQRSSARKKKAPRKTLDQRPSAGPSSHAAPGGGAAPSAPTRPAARAAERPGDSEAVALYEQGLLALQQRRFAEAAAIFRQVIARYPEERELLDRARLYLRVCEREMGPPPAAPQTVDDHLYAATLALNAGHPDAALSHLEAAAALAPDHDHLHYMLAVTHALRHERDLALTHLARAIALNPENRVLARQEPDFDALRGDPEFRRLIEPPRPVVVRRRGRGRVSR